MSKKRSKRRLSEDEIREVFNKLSDLEPELEIKYRSRFARPLTRPVAGCLYETNLSDSAGDAQLRGEA